MISPPPKTGDAALDTFLDSIHNYTQNIIPENGWSLSDFEASVSEVIGDKRDLIDIVTKYDNIDQYADAISEQQVFLEGVASELRNIGQHSEWFSEIMEWWDQNYRIIEDAATVMGFLQDAEVSASQSEEARDESSDLRDETEGYRTEARNYRDKAGEHRSGAEKALSDTEALAELTKTELGDIFDSSHADLNAFVETSKGDFDDLADSRRDELAAQITTGIEKVMADGAHAATTAGAIETQKAKNEADRSRREADRSERIALETTNDRLEEVVGGAPEELDTLKEVAEAIQGLGDDTQALISSISTKAEKSYVTTELDKKAEEEHSHLSDDISDATSTVGSEDESERVIKTLSTGWVNIAADPVADNHPARKAYVDAETAKKANAEHRHQIEDVDGLEDAINSAANAATWSGLPGKPEVFPSADHSHTTEQISDLPDIDQFSTAHAIVQRWGDGTAWLGDPDPDSPEDAVNVRYVTSETDKIRSYIDDEIGEARGYTDEKVSGLGLEFLGYLRDFSEGVGGFIEETIAESRAYADNRTPKIEVVDELPENPDSTTLYFVKES